MLKLGKNLEEKREEDKLHLMQNSEILLFFGMENKINYNTT